MQTAGADMTPNDLDRKAREPKFGDWLRGVYASERNPIRDGIYVRTCRVNHETCYELTDGKGKFWMYPKRSTERIDRPSVFEEAALRLAVPDGFVVVPREPTPEMLDAGWAEGAKLCESGAPDFAAAWTAMLAAVESPK